MGSGSHSFGRPGVRAGLHPAIGIQDGGGAARRRIVAGGSGQVQLVAQGNLPPG
jgi:hypothetical protein